MTETIKDGGAIEPKSGAQDPIDASGSTDPKQDTVAYSTFSKVLDERKRDNARMLEYKAKSEQYEQEKLEAEGKWQEIANKEKDRADKVAKELQTERASRAEDKIRTQISRKAKELGCVNTDDLIELMGFEGLDIVDGYKVSEQSLDMVLGKVKQEKAYLFSKPAPNIQDGTPANTVSQVKQESAANLSKDELQKRAIAIDKAEGRTLGWS